MTSRKKPPSDKKPLFERRDLVQVMGVPSPLMLVAEVAEEPEDDGEFTVTVIFFYNGQLVDDGYGEGKQFSEGLLQLVKPAAKVLEEAEEATRLARG